MTNLHTGHEAEIAALQNQDANMSINDMRRALVTLAEETLSQNEGFAAIFGDKTPEDFAHYLDVIASTAAAFAKQIRKGEYKA